jgi:hypothetical protein
MIGNYSVSPRKCLTLTSARPVLAHRSSCRSKLGSFPWQRRPECQHDRNSSEPQSKRPDVKLRIGRTRAITA